MQLVILGIYLASLLFFSIYIAIVVMHIGEFQKYSKYLSVVLRIYLLAIFCIAIFGGYKILTGKYVAPKKTWNQIQKMDF